MIGALLAVVLSGISIDGVVLTPDGKPAAGVRVTYLASELTPPGLECARRDNNVDYRRCFCPGDEAHWPKLEARGADVPVLATTDANGAFHVELPKRRFLSFAAADGSATGWLEAVTSKSGARVTMTPRPRPLTLRPSGPGGAPLPQGAIVAAPVDGQLVVAERKGDTFVLDLPDEIFHQVILFAPKLVPAFEHLNANGNTYAGRPPALKLQATTELLNGTVMSGGKPAPGAKVVIDPQGCRQEAVADALGTFTGVALAAPYLTTVEARSGELAGDALASAEQPGVIDLGPVVQLELDLRSGGQPIVDHSMGLVWHAANGKTINRFITPDEHGHLSLQLPPGKGTLDPAGVPVLESAKIAAASGKQTLTLELAPWLSGEVQVAADDGNPPASGWITVEPDPALKLTPLQLHQLKSHSYSLDGSGTLVLWAPKAGHYPVTLKSYGYDDQHLTVTVPGVTQGKLSAQHRLEGRVLDPTGAPAPHANVNARAATTSFGIQAEANGHYAFALPDAGTWTVSASSNASGPSAPLTLEVGTGSTHAPDLKLTMRLPITGVVVDAAGKPVPRAQVYVLPTSGPMGMSWAMMIRMNGRFPGAGPWMLEDRARIDGDILTAGPDGRFTFDPAAAVMVSAAVDGQQSDQVTDITPGEPPDGGLRLALARRDVVVGHVVDPAGKPFETFTLGSAPLTAKEGRFRINRPGSGTAHFEAPGFVPRDVMIAAGDGGVIDLGAVKLEAATKISGRVVDAVTGAPVKPGRVELQRDRDVFLANVNNDGSFVSNAVPVGQPLVFKVEAPHYAALHQAAVDGANLLKLERPASLEVRLTAKGKPQTDLQVVVTPKSPYEREMTMGSPRDGRVSIENLAPGEWHLKAINRQGEGRTLEGDVVLVAGKHSVQAFDFP